MRRHTSKLSRCPIKIRRVREGLYQWMVLMAGKPVAVREWGAEPTKRAATNAARKWRKQHGCRKAR